MDQKRRSIAEKYSLDYYRLPLPTRSWKNRWNYTALFLALLILAVMYLFWNNAAFQAAPVASVHSSFGTNCASCHDKSWAAARRLVALADDHHSVSDAACQKCHSTAAHASIPLTEPACVGCHQEHRPNQRLVNVTDSACTNCHRDLTRVAAVQTSFMPHVRKFEAGPAGHPEFLFHRRSDDSAGPRHETHSLVSFEAGQGGGKWLDRGGLRFNHRVHLDEAGVLNGARERTRLGCSDCHVPDSDSGYMRPIEYELHCAACHPLSSATPFADLGPLPHSSVEEVRGVVRERLARQIQQSEAQATAPGPARQLPRLPGPARLTSDEEHQLATRMELADQAVFGPAAKGMCRKCHHVAERDNQWHALLQNPMVAGDEFITNPKNAATMVPSRWMRHARFDHKSHRAVECVECHHAETSAETTDILMPSIAVCQTCHGDGAQLPSMRVRADCVLCHTYHSDAHKGNFEGVPLDRLFPTRAQASDSNPTP